MLKVFFCSLLILSSGTALVGCHGNADGRTYAERFVNGLPGDYTLVKDPTRQGSGWIILQVNGYHYAVDLNASMSGYASDYDFLLDNEIPVHSVGNGYYESNNGTLFEKGEGNPKDLLAMTERAEQVSNQIAAGVIAHDFGLSEERSEEIALLANEWRQLKNLRTMTDADVEKFSQPILGFNISTAAKAVQSGDTETVDALIEKAAETNDTTPENIRGLMVKFISE
jgi:hypothetical protein